MMIFDRAALKPDTSARSCPDRRRRKRHLLDGQSALPEGKLPRRAVLQRIRHLRGRPPTQTSSTRITAIIPSLIPIGHLYSGVQDHGCSRIRSPFPNNADPNIPYQAVEGQHAAGSGGKWLCVQGATPLPSWLKSWAFRRPAGGYCCAVQ